MELSNTARKDAENRLAAQLAKESNRLTLEEARWRRLRKQSAFSGFDAISDRVLKRDKYFCQACLMTAASKVFQYHGFSRISLDCTSIIAICDSCLEQIDLGAAEELKRIRKFDEPA